LFVLFYLAVWALLVLKDNPNVVVIMGLVALAGLVHGYAYGEGNLGAEMTCYWIFGRFYPDSTCGGDVCMD